MRNLAAQLLVVSRPPRLEARTTPVPSLALPPATEARIPGALPRQRPLGIRALALLHLAAAVPAAWLAASTGAWALLAAAGAGVLLGWGFWTGRRSAWFGGFAVHGALVALAAVLFALSARRSYYGAEGFALLGLVAGTVAWYLMTHRAVAWFHVERGT